MSKDHESDIPSGLDAFVRRLADLESVFGPAVRPTLAKVQDSIVRAMAARDRGDRAAAMMTLGEAMAAMAAFAEKLDPAEGAAMRAMARMFADALSRGDEAEAKRSAAFMFEKSGARARKSE